ncbi:MAG: hypothetical protein AB7T49_01970 [Oligoflexales bacterium]
MEGSTLKQGNVLGQSKRLVKRTLKRYKFEFVFLHKIRSFLISVPILVGVLWTTFPALRSLAAMGTLKLKGRSGFEEHLDSLDLKRAIQKHFLYYGTYIPLEDIALENELVGDEILSGVRRYCGKATLYVWVPYRFRLPVLGETLTEVCQTVR